MSLVRIRKSETLRDATIIFKNFAGEAKRYNPAGTRNFSVLLGEDAAAALMVDNWNVKALPRKEEDDQQLYHLKVAVNFANKPPRCWLITSGGRTMIGEGLIGMFDQLEFARVDLTITPYDWKLDSGDSGRKAYLETMFATMYENELEKEYAGVPQLAAAGDGAPLAIEGARDWIDADVVEDDDRR